MLKKHFWWIVGGWEWVYLGVKNACGPYPRMPTYDHGFYHQGLHWVLNVKIGEKFPWFQARRGKVTSMIYAHCSLQQWGAQEGQLQKSSRISMPLSRKPWPQNSGPVSGRNKEPVPVQPLNYKWGPKTKQNKQTKTRGGAVRQLLPPSDLGPV